VKRSCCGWRTDYGDAAWEIPRRFFAFDLGLNVLYFFSVEATLMGRQLSHIYLRQPNDESSGTVRLTTTRGRKRIAFGWYGGKFSHLDWLLPLLPDCHHYCEPFAGSGAVLLNRAPSPVETYNDIDGEVVNFFRVLRDQRDALVQAIALTPFSREEFYLAVSGSGAEAGAVEQARRFYVRARQARTGLAQTASLGRWANCKNTSRAGMSGVVSRWLGGVDALPEIAERLLRVQIENRPAVDVLSLYDDRETLFYCDPPYPHASRGDSKAYAFEMTDPEHWELARTLSGIKGKAAVSGYRCDLMDTLYKGWSRIDAPEKQCHSVKQIRQEALWVNY
jgi:DNA adenine methylase